MPFHLDSPSGTTLILLKACAMDWPWGPIVCENFVIFGSQAAKIQPLYLPTLHRCCILPLYQPNSYTEITERMSTKICQIVGANMA